MFVIVVMLMVMMMLMIVVVVMIVLVMVLKRYFLSDSKIDYQVHYFFIQDILG